MNHADHAGTTAKPAIPALAVAAVADIAVIVVFVSIGRRSHQESSAIADIARTAGPFLLALPAAWAAAVAWRDPYRLGTGAIVWAVTLALGMVFRRLVFGDGTALPFVIVASLFLAASFIGWRFLATRVSALRNRIHPGGADPLRDAST